MLPSTRLAPLCAASQAAKGRPGLPVSVLAGHAGPAAFVDFHPTLPDALLSASFDGTCRIWRARDAAAPPVVLRIDPTRFGLSGAAVTRYVDCQAGCGQFRCWRCLEAASLHAVLT